MSSTPDHITDRLLDLLADRAMGALSHDDAIELERLLSEYPGADRDAMDLAAAAAAIAMSPAPDDAMPASLRTKLIADAHKYAEARRTPIAKIDARDPNRRAPTASWFPWVLAAASITIAAFAWVYRPGPSTAPTAAQQLTQFEQQPPSDLVRIAWAGQPDPLVTEQLTGEVLWSQSQQKGFMKFSGLRANDPTREQYQLWIFDGTRDHPVDGGVFDIDADGNAIIPIDAKLTVREPTLFAVTVEKPGGVVVSNKERIAVIAPVDKG